MSDTKKKEYVNRYNELIDKYNSTKSLSLKGYYAGEMAVIEKILSTTNRS